MPRMMLLVGAVAVVVGAVVAAGCGGGGTSGGKTEEAAPSLPAGEIVFTRWVSSAVRSGERAGSPPSLYLVAPDGSRLRLLVRNAADAAVSPGGGRIALVRDGAIWVMERDGTGQRQLTNPDVGAKQDRFPGKQATEDRGPAWSADGQAVYFSRLDWATTTESIFSVGANGTGLRRLTNAASDTGTAGYGESYSNPAPSPDGGIVAYDYTSDSGHGNDAAIHAMTTTGKEADLPFAFPALAKDDTLDPLYDDRLVPLAWDGAWSPSGRLLVYKVVDVDAEMNGTKPISGLYVSASDGSKPRHLAPLRTEVGSPAWSTDSDWITFVNDTNDDGNLWLLHVDGTALSPITNTSADDRHPAWLPAAQ